MMMQPVLNPEEDMCPIEKIIHSFDQRGSPHSLHCYFKNAEGGHCFWLPYCQCDDCLSLLVMMKMILPSKGCKRSVHLNTSFQRICKCDVSVGALGEGGKYQYLVSTSMVLATYISTSVLTLTTSIKTQTSSL